MSRAEEKSRRSELKRKTKETEISISLVLDGSGIGEIDTGIGFLDHMLELLTRHGRFDLDVKAKGDLETGAHHTVEDVGIVLGQAFDRALGERSGITRFGSALVPMDEALALAAVDVSGRPLCEFDAELPAASLAGFDTELTEEFFRAFANNAKITLHVMLLAGSNAHHMVEATFKGFARALSEAAGIDPDESGVPSTKGVL